MSRGADKARGRGRAPAKASSARPPRSVTHRWRDYQTASGRRPIKEFLDGLDDEDLASVVAAMREVRQRGLQAARHLEGEIYEVRADGKGVIYRILFAPQGKHKQVFLARGAEEEDPEDARADHPPRQAALARLEATRQIAIFNLRYQSRDASFDITKGERNGRP